MVHILLVAVLYFNFAHEGTKKIQPNGKLHLFFHKIIINYVLQCRCVGKKLYLCTRNYIYKESR